MAKTSAHIMALSVGVDPKAFRAALIDQKFDWHADGADWSVETGTPEHAQMVAVLQPLFAKSCKPARKTRVRARKTRALKKAADAA